MLQAEGFSDAIAPALEKHDLDALYRTTGRGGSFTLVMTNEAYETHVVKQADLLVVERPPGGRVLATPEQLWLATAVTPPESCVAPEGNCLDQVRAVDGVERTSHTDPDDLATRETIDPTFAPAAVAGGPGPGSGGRLGIAVGARQSLVTTFLMYQGLAYLGTQATAWLARLGQGDALASAGGARCAPSSAASMVQLQRDGSWQTVAEVYETGPIATDVHLVVLPPGTPADHVRLRLPQGGWRIDSVALATLAGPASPTRVSPDTIRGTLGAEYAAARAPATAFPIVTMPGDRYELTYTLPPGKYYELVLDLARLLPRVDARRVDPRAGPGRGIRDVPRSRACAARAGARVQAAGAQGRGDVLEQPLCASMTGSCSASRSRSRSRAARTTPTRARRPTSN